MTEFTYYIMNKPRGCITACHDDRHQTVMEYLPPSLRDTLRPIGRLDKDTEGLLLFTDDGKFNQALMHPEQHVEKTYFFWALGTLNDEHIEQFKQGVTLIGSDKKTAPATLTIDEKKEITDILPYLNLEQQPRLFKNPRNSQVVSGFLTITEGKKHQVKRMLKAVGCYVVYLKRISIGQLQLDNTLAPGECRPMTKKEMDLLGIHLS